MSIGCTVILTSILYILLLVLLIIPLSSIISLLYILLEPFQACGLFPNWSHYLFSNFIQLPLNTTEAVIQLYRKENPAETNTTRQPRTTSV